MEIPSGEGVLAKNASAGKVIGFYAALIGAGVGLAWLVGNMLSSASAQTQAALAANSAAALENVHQLDARIAALHAELTALTKVLGAQAGDIRVIQRQLGIDGLGAAPAAGRKER